MEGGRRVGGVLSKILIQVCAAKRCCDFGTLEREIQFRDVS